jgi:hypothetical protein
MTCGRSRVDEVSQQLAGGLEQVGRLLVQLVHAPENIGVRVA